LAVPLAGFSQFCLIFPKPQNPPELGIFISNLCNLMQKFFNYVTPGVLKIHAIVFPSLFKPGIAAPSVFLFTINPNHAKLLPQLTKWLDNVQRESVGAMIATNRRRCKVG